jgi:hypothetical protein
MANHTEHRAALSGVGSPCWADRGKFFERWNAEGDAQRYRDHISGFLSGPIDMHIEIPAVQYQDLTSATPADPPLRRGSRRHAATVATPAAVP